jgi:hypothetical protein
LFLVLAGLVVAVLSLIPALASLGRDETPDAESPPSELPDGVTTYDIRGGPAPEFVSIRGQVLAVPAEQSDPWWVDILNPGSTLGAALVAAGAVWYQTSKGRAGLESRISELEAQVRSAGGSA